MKKFEKVKKIVKSTFVNHKKKTKKTTKIQTKKENKLNKRRTLNRKQN